MMPDRFFIIDATKILNEQQSSFNEFQKEHSFVSYSDLYDIVLLSFHIPPINNDSESFDYIYRRVCGYYYYHADILGLSSSFDIMLENVYMSILDAIDCITYSYISREKYDPDMDALIGQQYLSPKTILLRATRIGSIYG
jgi:hypothetical protein